MPLATAVQPAVTSAPPANGDEVLYEIIDGRWVELPPMSFFAARIASRLVGWLIAFSRTKALGEAVMETLFHLPLPLDRNRRPDVAFVSLQRLRQAGTQPKDDNAWNVVPNLAVEVVSPNELAEDLLEKIEEYFQAGVQMVWVVYPRRQIIQVYESLTHIRGLTRTDELDGGTVLPGFRLPLATLFEEQPVSA